MAPVTEIPRFLNIYFRGIRAVLSLRLTSSFSHRTVGGDFDFALVNDGDQKEN